MTPTEVIEKIGKSLTIGNVNKDVKVRVSSPVRDERGLVQERFEIGKTYKLVAVLESCEQIILEIDEEVQK
jgi:hypothetical protein